MLPGDDGLDTRCNSRKAASSEGVDGVRYCVNTDRIVENRRAFDIVWTLVLDGEGEARLSNPDCATKEDTEAAKAEIERRDTRASRCGRGSDSRRAAPFETVLGFSASCFLRRHHDIRCESATLRWIMRRERRETAMARSEPAVRLVSAEHQPDEFLIAAYATGADAMMELFRGPTGVLPEEDTLQSLINDRYRPPMRDGASISELAELSFRAGTRAVIEVFAAVTGKAIGPMERLRTAALARWEREAAVRIAAGE
jgi:hypothetical protein